jgi:glucose dehydrogenase
VDMSWTCAGRKYAIVALVATMLAGCSSRNAEHGKYRTSFDLARASLSDDWLTYGHDYGNQRFSRLSQINAGNVNDLVPAYVFQTGALGPMETSPIVSHGMMFISTAYDGVFAINATNGSLIWSRPPLHGAFAACCGPVNRGVAISHDLVLVGQLDDTLVALARKTGAVKWATRLANNDDGYSITMAPLVYRDSVIVGVGGGDLGIRGAISAYSLNDGKLKWRWYSTNARDWFGTSLRLRSDDGWLSAQESVSARNRYVNSWKRGGGGIWTTPAIDPGRDTIYLATGNPWPNLDGNTRPGDNLFTDSIVALNASSGKMRWYFQEVPHDTLDLDAASPPVLFDTLDAKGEHVAALAEIGKTGFVYILDRDTGKLIRRSRELAAASTTATGEPIWTGGSSWSPMSYDPNLGYALVTASQHLRSGKGDRETARMSEMLREWRHIYGTVSAVNTQTGAIVWQDIFDGGLVGGTTSTAGNLTFVGEGSGYFDALDTKTGVRLWQFQTGAGANAPPVAFEVGNEEYVAIASGGNQQLGTPYGDAIFVFRLHR